MSNPNAQIPRAFLKEVQFMEKYNEPLKSYIRRCFGQCQNDTEKDFVSKKLLTKIKLVTTQQGLSTFNWTSEKLVPRSEYWEKQEQMQHSQEQIQQQQQQFQQRMHNFPSRTNSQDSSKKDFNQFGRQPNLNKGHQQLQRYPPQQSPPQNQQIPKNYQQNAPQQQPYNGQNPIQPDPNQQMQNPPQYGQPPYNPYQNQMPPYQQYNPYQQQYNQPPQYQNMPPGYPNQYGQVPPPENQPPQQQQQMPYNGQQQLPPYTAQSPQQNSQYPQYKQTNPQQNPYGQDPYSMQPNPYGQNPYDQQQPQPYPPPQYGAQSPTPNPYGPAQYGQQQPMSPTRQNPYQGYNQQQMYPPQNQEYNQQYQSYQQQQPYQNQDSYQRKYDNRQEGEEGYHRQGRVFDNRRGGRVFQKRGRGRGFYPRANFRNDRYGNDFENNDQRHQLEQEPEQEQQPRPQSPHQSALYNKNNSFEDEDNDKKEEQPLWPKQIDSMKESAIIPIDPNKIKLRFSNDNSDSDYSDFVRNGYDNSSNEYDKNSEEYYQKGGSDYDSEGESYKHSYQQRDRGYERNREKYNKHQQYQNDRYYKKNANGKYNRYGNDSDDSSTGQGPAQYQAFLHPLDEEKLDKMIEEKRIIGTSQALEKQYLRLTGGYMDPNDFRPLEVLKKSLDYCMQKYENNHDYTYICDQLRSIRQDISVQNIEDEFAVQVYELHIRLAIDNNDWENFNQVQSNLELLYRKGFGKQENKEEMYCYHILYLCDVDDLTGFYQFIPRIDESLLSTPLISFAIDAWKAASQKDWMTFFKMMKNAPKQCQKVMQRKAKDIRFYGLTAITKALKKTTFSMYQDLLCFDNLEDTKQYLKVTNVYDSVVDE